MIHFKYFLLASFLIYLSNLYAKNIYVNVNAPFGGNGQSWTKAFNDLQTAINASQKGDEIWVAKGTYRGTFTLANNLKMFGGFSGNESSINQANPTANVTTLSGDLLGNDVSDPNHPDYLTLRSENVPHVLIANNVLATIDGFTVSGGNAIAAGDVGGGLYANNGSKVTLSDMTFKENAADRQGGGIQFEGSNSTLDINNSKFTNNFQTSAIIDTFHGGAGISVVNDAAITLKDSEFSQNRSGEDGSAIRIENSNGEIKNAVFHDNKATASGTIAVVGAFELFSNQPHTVTIKNTQIENNIVGTFGNGIVAIGIFQHPDSQLNVENVTIKNGDALLGGAIAVVDRNTTIKNSNFINNRAHATAGAILNNSSFDVYFNSGNLTTMEISGSIFSGNVNMADNPFIIPGLSNFFPPFVVSGVFGGGAIANNANATLMIQNSTFSNNVTLRGNGGAILNAGVTLTNGGVNIGYGGNLIITNSTFKDNQALGQNGDGGNGGAIASQSVAPVGLPNMPLLSVSNSNFTDNEALVNGNAIYTNESDNTYSNNHLGINQIIFNQP